MFLLIAVPCIIFFSFAFTFNAIVLKIFHGVKLLCNQLHRVVASRFIIMLQRYEKYVNYATFSARNFIKSC